MTKKKLNCQTCANQVNGIHCTRRKKMDVKSRVYKKCDGYKKYVKPPKKEIIKKVKKESYEGEFGSFLKNGGHYSFRQ